MVERTVVDHETLDGASDYVSGRQGNVSFGLRGWSALEGKYGDLVDSLSLKGRPVGATEIPNFFFTNLEECYAHAQVDVSVGRESLRNIAVNVSNNKVYLLPENWETKGLEDTAENYMLYFPNAVGSVGGLHSPGGLGVVTVTGLDASKSYDFFARHYQMEGVIDQYGLRRSITCTPYVRKSLRLNGFRNESAPILALQSGTLTHDATIFTKDAQGVFHLRQSAATGLYVHDFETPVVPRPFLQQSGTTEENLVLGEDQSKVIVPETQAYNTWLAHLYRQYWNVAPEDTDAATLTIDRTTGNLTYALDLSPRWAVDSPSRTPRPPRRGDMRTGTATGSATSTHQST